MIVDDNEYEEPWIILQMLNPVGPSEEEIVGGKGGCSFSTSRIGRFVSSLVASTNSPNMLMFRLSQTIYSTSV